MKYQLVLQCRGDSLEDYDAMIALEERLIEDLGDSADVDGHDCGSGETNIFIYTSNPAKTFVSARQTLQNEGRLQDVIAAYREYHGEVYTVLWPEGYSEKFTVS